MRTLLIAATLAALSIPASAESDLINSLLTPPSRAPVPCYICEPSPRSDVPTSTGDQAKRDLDRAMYEMNRRIIDAEEAAARANFRARTGW